MKRLALIFLAACSSTTAAEPGPVPSESVLCEVWAGNGVTPGTNAFQGVPGYGSLSTDVIAAWGEPSERKGNVWTYEWTTAGRAVSASLTFESHDLCYSGSKHIGGLWLSKIETNGIADKECWNYEFRGDAKTCDGCLEHGEVHECL